MNRPGSAAPGSHQAPGDPYLWLMGKEFPLTSSPHDAPTRALESFPCANDARRITGGQRRRHGESSGMGMQRNTQGVDDLQDRTEIRTTLTRKRLVQAFPGKPRVPRDLAHSFCAGDVAECLGDKSGIAVGLFKTGFEIGGHLFRGAQMLGDIVTTCLDLGRK